MSRRLAGSAARDSAGPGPQEEVRRHRHPHPRCRHKVGPHYGYSLPHQSTKVPVVQLLRTHIVW